MAYIGGIGCIAYQKIECSVEGFWCITDGEVLVHCISVDRVQFGEVCLRKGFCLGRLQWLHLSQDSLASRAMNFDAIHRIKIMSTCDEIVTLTMVKKMKKWHCSCSIDLEGVF